MITENEIFWIRIGIKLVLAAIIMGTSAFLLFIWHMNKNEVKK